MTTPSRKPKPLDTDRETWRQQGHETPKQYERFLHYCRLGRMRSLTEVTKSLTEFGDKLTYGTVRTQSYLYRWNERAQAWDLHQDELDRERVTQARRDMNERQLKVASGLLTKAVAALRDIDSHDLDPSDIVRWIKLATDLERAVLGEPQQTISVTGPAGGPIQTEDLSSIPPGVRRARLRELAIELASRVGLSTTSTEDD